MRIGIFGGSFDPVHLEHVRLVESAIQDLSLDRVFVVPTHTPPHKQGKRLASDEHRLQMCNLAFSHLQKVEISDFEIRQGGTSYTYLTLRRFRKLYPRPDHEIFFLVGTDMLRDFPTWKNPEDILKNCTLAVCARAEQSGWTEKEQAVFFEKFRTHFLPLSYEGKAVSSTRVRVLAAAGEDVSAFVGESVGKYLEENALYQIPYAKEALMLEKEERKEHSLRVAFYAAEHARKCKVDEEKAITASLFHDCAKNLAPSSPYLYGFTPPNNVPPQIMHQYAGAYVAKTWFSVQDSEILDAISYHTSGRKNMSDLEKLVYFADMVEEGRTYDGVEFLRETLEKRGLDQATLLALYRSKEFVEEKGNALYELTKQAIEDLEEKEKNGGDGK